MRSLPLSAFSVLMLSVTTAAGLGACGGETDEGPGAGEAGTGGTVAGAAATAGNVGDGGRAGSSGGGLSAGRGGSQSTAGSAGKGGAAAGAAGRATSSGGSGGVNGNAGSGGWPVSSTGDSPYEIECHGDTSTCGAPTSLLCLGLRVETQVFGYSCSNECQTDADCSDQPASTDAAPGCVDFVNKKYCLLVCQDHDQRADCPSGMYCYAYAGATIGYCLWE